eukprot:CAMPEP_0115577282 /NCGR_PEP_ID=MMETSP0272-20121206/2990_1 /TAXON_ID=71861 /ORGANISM="Scrippsiella trochoidea, Strain CCMP3099" /LENGTH=102 /DNA_ID=CAMNT_0003012085 /DNA_START=97 /DNA_END=402 /DNA_ORIENTATION=-
MEPRPSSVEENMTRCLCKPALNAPTDSNAVFTSSSRASVVANPTTKSSAAAHNSKNGPTASATATPLLSKSVPSKQRDTQGRRLFPEPRPEAEDLAESADEL